MPAAGSGVDQARLKDIAAVPPSSRLLDPARDAARLLGWSGLTILMVGAPLLSVVSRRALVVLLPIGACVLLAAVFVTVSREGLGMPACTRRAHSCSNINQHVPPSATLERPIAKGYRIHHHDQAFSIESPCSRTRLW